jgi:hypothetical protein
LCTRSDTFYVHLPALGQQLEDTVLCSEQHAALTLKANVPAEAVLWSAGSTAASISVSDSGTYWVSVTDGNLRRQ